MSAAAGLDGAMVINRIEAGENLLSKMLPLIRSAANNDYRLLLITLNNLSISDSILAASGTFRKCRLTEEIILD